MPSSRAIIHIHPSAPRKPAWGAACNGCGLCCLAEPCPLGVLLSGKRKGSCRALRWDDGARLYRCGALVAPREVLAQALPALLRAGATPLALVLHHLAARWIAAGKGCDCALETEDETD